MITPSQFTQTGGSKFVVSSLDPYHAPTLLDIVRIIDAVKGARANLIVLQIDDLLNPIGEVCGIFSGKKRFGVHGAV